MRAVPVIACEYRSLLSAQRDLCHGQRTYYSRYDGAPRKASKNTIAAIFAASFTAPVLLVLEKIRPSIGKAG
jgi:hypothetical protein